MADTKRNKQKNDWIAKAYQQYRVNLRKDTDADLIEYIEQLKSTGDGVTDIFRRAIMIMMAADDLI